MTTVTLHLLGELSVNVQDLLMDSFHECGVDLHGCRDYRIAEVIADVLAVTRPMDALLEGREIVLVTDDLDMPLKLRVLPGEVNPAADEIASGAHVSGIRVGEREHTGAKQLGDLL